MRHDNDDLNLQLLDRLNEARKLKNDNQVLNNEIGNFKGLEAECNQWKKVANEF